METERIKKALEIASDKYFGDYELSEAQMGALNTLIELAEAVLKEREAAEGKTMNLRKVMILDRNGKDEKEAYFHGWGYDELYSGEGSAAMISVAIVEYVDDGRCNLWPVSRIRFLDKPE